MKKLLIIPLLLFTSNLWATTYHVASDGSGECTTLSDVEALSLVAGDQVLFRYGDTFTASTQFDITESGASGNPIYIGAYEDGTGHLSSNGKPVITGWATIEGTWAETSPGSNIWKRSAKPSIGTRLRLGRLTETMKAGDETLVSSSTNWGEDASNYLYVYATSEPVALYAAGGGIQTPGGPDWVFNVSGSYITLDNLDIRGGLSRTLTINGTSDNPITGIEVKNCKIYDRAGYGIYLSYITHSLFHSIEFDSNYTVTYVAGSDPTLDAADDLAPWTGTQYCCFYNNTFKNFQHGAVNFLSISSNAVDQCSYNKFYDNYLYVTVPHYNRALSTQGNPYGACHNNYLYNNLIIGQSIRTQILGNNNYYFNNIFMDGELSPVSTTRGQAVMFQEYSGYVSVENYFVNNTIINSYAEGILFESSATGYRDNVIENNIILNCDALGGNHQISVTNIASEIRSGNIVKNNIIYPDTVYDRTTDRTTDGWEANFNSAFSAVSGNLHTDPNLLPNGLLQVGSNAINAGLDVSNPFDYRGIKRDTTPDIGAYEYVVGVQLSTSAEGVSW